MSKELIVSAGRHETRVAILDDDQVVELFHEREKEYSLAGSIHKGRVTRVLPGMQSAFVDIGLERDAFLYVSDFFEDNEEYDAVVSTVEEKVLKMERSGGGRNADQQRPERKEAAASGEESSDAEAPGAEGAAPVAAAAATPSSEQRRPDAGGGRQDHEGRGDRGGRGRRGRRRRGGRGGGLPDSKFFSPRAETSSTAEKESENETHDEEATDSWRASQSEESDADFMVLPGESLAKYSADEEPAAEESPKVEMALPSEHPLAGFGEVASWVTSEPAVEIEVAASSDAEAANIEKDVEEDTVEAPEVMSSAVIVENNDDGLSAGEVAEAELAADVQVAETFEANGTPQDAVETAIEDAPAEEGPEPARIPTSLTATLREQGHRYPHRVSRRMRRKMRGGQSGETQTGEEGQRQPGGDLKGETRSVSSHREERGQAESGEHSREQNPREQNRDSRQDRGGRERPERDRTPLPSISDLLKEGQEIIVQIAKEPLGQKGARITSHIALPGRFVVYMPTVEHVGVSRKIPSDE